MLMKLCAPIQMPMPWATRPAKTRSSAMAWRPITKMRRVIQKKAGSRAPRTKPSSSPITASRKSVWASGR
jgi:hypothetical protein